MAIVVLMYRVRLLPSLRSLGCCLNNTWNEPIISTTWHTTSITRPFSWGGGELVSMVGTSICSWNIIGLFWGSTPYGVCCVVNLS